MFFVGIHTFCYLSQYLPSSSKELAVMPTFERNFPGPIVASLPQQ